MKASIRKWKSCDGWFDTHFLGPVLKSVSFNTDRHTYTTFRWGPWDENLSGAQLTPNSVKSLPHILNTPVVYTTFTCAFHPRGKGGKDVYFQYENIKENDLKKYFNISGWNFPFQLGYAVDFTCIPFLLWSVKNCILTVESQIAKYGSHKVHHKHGKKWDIWNQLHFFLWTAGERRKEHIKMVGLDFSIAV